MELKSLNLAHRKKTSRRSWNVNSQSKCASKVCQISVFHVLSIKSHNSLEPKTYCQTKIFLKNNEVIFESMNPTYDLNFYSLNCVFKMEFKI